MKITELYPLLSDQGLKDLIEMVHIKTGIDPSILEKDFYLTGLLKKTIALSPDKDNIYFKGGTALAKCHHIVDRFSEDIDLFVFSGDLKSTKSREDNLNKRVTHVLMDTYPEDILPGSKRGGNYSKVQLSYNITFPNSGFKPHVEFEISSCALRDKSRYSVDSSILTVQPIIGEMLDKNGYSHLAEKFDLGKFPIQCLSPEKALCDKISRIIRVSYDDNPITSMVHYIRDAYDVAMFLTDKRFVEFLASSDFLEKMYVTNLEDRLRSQSHALESYSNAVMFSNPDKIFSDTAVKNAYKHMVDGFVFHPEKAPQLNDVVSIFASMLPAMDRFDTYRREQDNGMGGAGGGGTIMVTRPDNPDGPSGNSAIRKDDSDALHSLGLDDKQISRLQTDGSLTVDSYNYRPAEEWDKNIPKKKATMTFVLHDNKVFVRHPGKGLEKPLLDIIHNEKELSRFSFKTKRQKKQAPSRKPQIKTLKRR